MARRDTPLPTGLVTFLLTDIEGSTQAWQTAPDEMTAIVSRHYQILDAAVATRGGVRPQEQGEGDSIVAVFVDPVAAVNTALEAQLALRRELPDLPVRMALHTGETMLRNEDNYVGLTIIRCARMSLSSQRAADGWGKSSEEGWIELYSVHTTPQLGLPFAIVCLL